MNDIWHDFALNGTSLSLGMWKALYSFTGAPSVRLQGARLSWLADTAAAPSFEWKCVQKTKEWFKKERLGEYWPVWLHLKALESMAPCSPLASTQRFWEETPALLSVSDYSPFTLADPPILTTHAVIEQHLPLWFRIDHFYSYESFTHTYSVFMLTSAWRQGLSYLMWHRCSIQLSASLIS